MGHIRPYRLLVGGRLWNLIVSMYTVVSVRVRLRCNHKWSLRMGLGGPDSPVVFLRVLHHTNNKDGYDTDDQDNADAKGSNGGSRELTWHIVFV